MHFRPKLHNIVDVVEIILPPPQATPYMYIPQQDPQSWKPKIIMMLRTCSIGGGEK